jgi:hypothetical protein
MVAAYSIAYGRTKQHAAQLRAGLARLPADFAARLCGVCNGEGEYEQTFTHGCGGGYYRAMSGCDHCDDTGLMQGRSPAPASVLEQVLGAARQAA